MPIRNLPYQPYQTSQAALQVQPGDKSGLQFHYVGDQQQRKAESSVHEQWSSSHR